MELLTSHALFRDLPPRLMDRIAALVGHHHLAAGAMLFEAGDEGDALYAVVDGAVRLVDPASAVELAVVEPGAVFGEIALLDGRPRTARAVAVADTELLVISRPDFLALVEQEPEIIHHFLHLLCERMRSTNELITRRRAAERALEDQLRFQQTLIDAIPSPIFYRDTADRYLGCNAAYAHPLGLTPGDIVGKTPGDLRPADLARHYQETDLALLERPHIQVYETPFPTADGTEGDFLVTKTAFRDARGQVAGIVGVMTDITERKRLEGELRRSRDSAQAADQAKSAFLAMMSHEIRTPLNGILGLAALLQDSPLGPQQKDWVDTLHQSGEALLTVLNDVLDYSKLEANEVAFENAPFDLARLVKGVVDLMRGRAREKGLDLEAMLAPDVPVWVSGDAGRLRQVLLNLVANGVKFTEQGRVIVRVLPDGPGRPRVDLRFQVVDTGPGIPPEVQPRLFRSFTQADESISRRYGGTGLGLAICKRLVDLQGGRIGVDSTPGVGSRFWFRLTFDRVESPAPAPAPAPAVAAGRCLDILLAEDNVVNQKVTVGLLERRGHRVRVVEDGEAAVAAVSEHAYDLVLMDMQMPDMDGLAASRAIRALPAPAGRVPIAAMTANALAGDRERCLAAGMNDYLAKPVTPDRLDDLLGRLTPAADGEVDLSALAQLERELGPETTGDLLRLFLEDAGRRCAAIADFHRDGDSTGLRRAAHDLKSNAGSFGLRDLGDVARAIEQAAAEGRPGDIAGLVSELDVRLAGARARLARQRPDLMAPDP